MIVRQLTRTERQDHSYLPVPLVSLSSIPSPIETPEKEKLTAVESPELDEAITIY